MPGCSPISHALLGQIVYKLKVYLLQHVVKIAFSVTLKIECSVYSSNTYLKGGYCDTELTV